MESQKQKKVCKMQETRITVEQRCYAAQALWMACNYLLGKKNPHAMEWLECIGYNQMRYKCRCKHTVEAFFEAYTPEAEELWPIAEDFADVFLRVCVTRKSMNVNRDWQTYLQKEIAAVESGQAPRRPV